MTAGIREEKTQAEAEEERTTTEFEEKAALAAQAMRWWNG